MYLHSLTIIHDNNTVQHSTLPPVLPFPLTKPAGMWRQGLPTLRHMWRHTASILPCCRVFYHLNRAKHSDCRYNFWFDLDEISQGVNQSLHIFHHVSHKSSAILTTTSYEFLFWTLHQTLLRSRNQEGWDVRDVNTQAKDGNRPRGRTSSRLEDNTETVLNQIVCALTGTWLKTRIRSGPLWTWQWSFEFHETWAI